MVAPDDVSQKTSLMPDREQTLTEEPQYQGSDVSNLQSAIYFYKHLRYRVDVRSDEES